MFTGTLIADLIATVERAEARTQDRETQDFTLNQIEPWMASAIQEDAAYDSKLIEVA